MKKITTVLIAMLLLTLSVLAAHADQEGNARWCNIDSHGCYLNEEGGAKSYMHFWSVESCKYFMGNDDPCKNVVARYDKDNHRMPLEPAPEPVVYRQPAVKKFTERYTVPVTIIQLISGEEVFRIMFPEGVAEFNGVMIVTDLDGLQDEGTQRLVSLETAGSGEELMIPVYLPKEGSSQENFLLSISDLGPMTAELSDSGKAALLGDGSGNKSSFLIPYVTEGDHAGEMNSYLDSALEENFVLAGYVSSSGVGVSPNPDRRLEAKHIDSGQEESGGSGSDDDKPGSSLPVQFSNNEFDKSSESINLPGPASNNPDDTESSGRGKRRNPRPKMYGGAIVTSSNAVLEVESGDPQGSADNEPDFDDGRLFLFNKNVITGGSLTASNGKIRFMAAGGVSIQGTIGGNSLNRGEMQPGKISADPVLSDRYSPDSGKIFVINVPAFPSGSRGNNVIISTENDQIKKLIGSDLTEKITENGYSRLYAYPISSGGYETLTMETKDTNSEFEIHLYNDQLKEDNFIFKMDLSDPS